MDMKNLFLQAGLVASISAASLSIMGIIITGGQLLGGWVAVFIIFLIVVKFMSPSCKAK